MTNANETNQPCKCGNDVAVEAWTAPGQPGALMCSMCCYRMLDTCPAGHWMWAVTA